MNGLVTSRSALRPQAGQIAVGGNNQLSNALTDLGLCKPHEHAHGPWLVHTASVATDLMITTNTLQGECSIKDFGTEPPHHRASQLSRCL
jgi:hypothetical protein